MITQVLYIGRLSELKIEDAKFEDEHSTSISSDPETVYVIEDLMENRKD